MAITFEDIFDVSGEEESGRVTKLQRRGTVRGLTSTDADDYVSEVLSSSALPASGSAIVMNGSFLYLRRRSVRLDDQSELGAARVDLFYERNEGSTSETSETPTLRGGTTLKQVTTQLDASGTPITVEHNFTDDGDVARLEDAGHVLDDGTHRQGGEIQVMVPMSQLSGRFIKATNSPGAISQDYAGHVNATSWQGGSPRTWICTQVNFELIDDTVSPPLWAFDFAFEYDEKTWDNDTTAVYIDPTTGNMPENLVIGKGIKKVQFYPTKNFNEDF